MSAGCQGCDMSYGFSPAASENNSFLNFSTFQERATLVDPEDSDENIDSMPPRRRRRSKRLRKKRPIRRGLKGVRVTKGRISLKVGGYSGIQKLGASELIHFIPLAKLRVAAKKVLRRSGASKTRIRKRRGKGRRKRRRIKRRRRRR